MAEITLEELARRVGALERRFDSVANDARQRQDDWGTVKGQAGKVAELVEQLRELGREVERLRGQRPTAAVLTPAAVRPAFDLKDSLAKDLDPKAIAALIVERVSQQIKVEELLERIIAQIAEKLASQIEITTKRRY